MLRRYFSQPLERMSNDGAKDEAILEVTASAQLLQFSSSQLSVTFR